ncbi:hypothetical protein NPIL_334201 [Nephila pilipes]|uniref:Uncharacterized protein n=1 Tax=Nephila pilipes TaxID=299642 RepID=A0A8X6T8A2_NEPPI|nr:hypothetical protein NPIL_334201 [Nephila pilipes]
MRVFTVCCYSESHTRGTFGRLFCCRNTKDAPCFHSRDRERVHRIPDGDVRERRLRIWAKSDGPMTYRCEAVARCVGNPESKRFDCNRHITHPLGRGACLVEHVEGSETPSSTKRSRV